MTEDLSPTYDRAFAWTFAVAAFLLGLLVGLHLMLGNGGWAAVGIAAFVVAVVYSVTLFEESNDGDD